MKLTRSIGEKKGDQWGIGQRSMKKENFETRVCTCGHNNQRHAQLSKPSSLLDQPPFAHPPKKQHPPSMK
jgi:hypothetical protein